MNRIARCSCGQMSLELSDDPVLNALCHCADCKRRTGSAFGWQAYFLEGHVGAQKGNAAPRAVPVAEPQIRHFCPECGTTVWWTSGTAPGLVGVAAGTIEPALDQPIATYSDDGRCSWLELPANWVRYP